MYMHTPQDPHSSPNPPLGCDNAQLVSALDDEDSGTLNLGYGIQNLQEDLFNAAMGYQDMSTSATRNGIPNPGTGSNYGPKECLARCAAAKQQSSSSPTCGPPAPRQSSGA